MPLRQSLRLAAYLAKMKLKRVEKFPILVELEPLFACNLKCAGCGKIAQPAHLLKQRMPVDQAVGAVLESGAPMVSIAGGEPLMHKEIDEIVRQLLDRGTIAFPPCPPQAEGDRRDRPAAAGPRQDRLPVHERAAAAQAPAQVQAAPQLR